MRASQALKRTAEASEFVAEAFKHCKAIAAAGAGVDFVSQSLGEDFGDGGGEAKPVAAKQGVVTTRAEVTANFAKKFVQAIARRHWEREDSKR